MIKTCGNGFYFIKNAFFTKKVKEKFFCEVMISAELDI
jgi:hypothetical protein